ncbi:MAG TPA: acyl carrier protein [Alphaproteobacteria bacterium]|nr:acyl carrier protein [Alphaproteobacteria bacterium]
MTKPSLISLLKQKFPTASFDETARDLEVGSFPEWNSLAHFNFLMLVEETYGARFSLDEISSLKSLEAIQKALDSQEKA